MAALILPAILVPGATLIAAILCFLTVSGDLDSGSWQGQAAPVVIASEMHDTGLAGAPAGAEIERTGSIEQVRAGAAWPHEEIASEDEALPLRGTLDAPLQAERSAAADQGDEAES